MTTSQRDPSRSRSRWTAVAGGFAASAGALAAVACGAGSSGVALPVGADGLPPPAGDLTSPFDTARPTVARLDPDLRAAVQDAARDARRDGVTMVVNSGWRSRAHQQRLFDEAVAAHGSEEEARRYVATPEASAHVTGDAVDIGPPEAAGWLGRHGAAYGLCQVFANEAWHFELSVEPGERCPEMLPDGSARGW